MVLWLSESHRVGIVVARASPEAGVSCLLDLSEGLIVHFGNALLFANFKSETRQWTRKESASCSSLSGETCFNAALDFSRPFAELEA